MTALKGRSIKDFLAKRDPKYSAVLIYGPDAGLVRDRSDHLALQIIEDFKDPFNYLELTDADLKAEPGRIRDEAAALSFAGGERVVRIRGAGETVSKPAADFLDALDKEHVKSNALVLVEGGDLGPRSGLRKAFEKARCGAALPCYSDAPADVRALAVDAAAAEDLKFDDDAIELLVSALGDDRGLSKSEINKIILFKGPKSLRDGPATISLEDVRASIVDGLGDAMDDTAAACADGDAPKLAKALQRASAAGASPIGLLRALQRNFSRLETARRFVDKGESPAAAMKKLRPPVFFGEQRAFERRLQRWRGPVLEKALRSLIEAELAAKSSGAPQQEIVERAALRLAMMGKR